MNRLCIFVFYDSRGIVSEYVLYLLRELQPIVTEQMIVVNGLLQPESKKKLLQITDHILVRQNKGFDAGAYKDTFLHYLSYTELQRYDEIILCNDTFYGPFFPFTEIWQRMEEVPADFWGFTRHPEGVFGDGCPFPAHIQSYFLVLKRSLFLTSEFRMFWEQEVPYGTELMDAVKEFEVKFTSYFEERGFTSAALTDFIEDGQINIKYNENPYVVHSYNLLFNRICPVLKRKCLLLSDDYFGQALQAYTYICERTSYPEKLIKDHIRRLNREGSWCAGWDLEKLESFYLAHRSVYIYGAGKWGKSIQTYFKYRKWNIGGVFVSDREKANGSERIFQQGILGELDGIVVALGRKNLWTVVETLRKSLKENQLFIPEYE